MFPLFRTLLISISFALLSALPAIASLEWSVGPTIQLGDEAVDSVAAPDGSRLYVLTKTGKIIILNQQGQTEATIGGPFQAESLSISPDGKRLYLTGKGKTLQVISLLDRFEIPVGGSPVRGDIAAAITVAVFSDFQ